MRRLALAPLVILLAAGCDGGAVGSDDGGVGVDAGAPPARDAGAGALPGRLPVTGERYKVVRGRGAGAGTEVAAEALFAAAADADAICLGERHDDARSHAVQELVFGEIVRRAGDRRLVALGLEMIERPYQKLLDDFAAGRTTEAALQAHWKARWGFDYALYEPTLDRALAARAPLLALNAPAAIVSKVGKMGLAGLTPEERAQIAETIDLQDAAHKDAIRKTIGEMHVSGAQFENVYTAQVVRDETMAETAWTWLNSPAAPPRQIALLAGYMHCIDGAIPARLRRRGARAVVSFRTEDDGEPARKALAEGYTDFVVVVTP
jgi:uncharacterized iron-regulated protein